MPRFPDGQLMACLMADEGVVLDPERLYEALFHLVHEYDAHQRTARRYPVVTLDGFYGVCRSWTQQFREKTQGPQGKTCYIKCLPPYRIITASTLSSSMSKARAFGKGPPPWAFPNRP